MTKAESRHASWVSAYRSYLSEYSKRNNSLPRRMELAKGDEFKVAFGWVETFVGRTITSYSFYGGGAGSPAWAQVLADVLDRPVHRIADSGYANAFGTAMFGFDRLGLASADDLADRLPIADVAEPDPAHRARHAERFEAFQDAFRRTRPVMHALGRAGRS